MSLTDGPCDTEVLKGDSNRAQTVTVKLQHLYSVETRNAGWASARTAEAVPDGIPKLCYKQQLMNPGSLMPVPMLADARQPAIYFLPSASQPALKKRGQVQPFLLPLYLRAAAVQAYLRDAGKLGETWVAGSTAR